MAINENHLADLRGSGLSDNTIESLGIYSADSEEVRKLLNRSTALGPGLVFPYFMFPGFVSVKLDVAPPGSSHRYRHTIGSKNHLYIPPLAQQILNDDSAPLMITEGEKKAAKACQEGIPCIAISGVWNWLTKVNKGTPDEVSLPLSDFDLIKLTGGRRVSIVFDSDAIVKEEIHKAAISLQGFLEEKKGAETTITFLPSSTKKKVGLDDYLLTHTVDDLRTLINTPILLPKVFRNFQITKIEKTNSSPPIYHVFVNGRDVEMSIEEFAKFSAFATKVAAKIDFFVSIEKPVAENWKNYVNAALSSEYIFVEKESPREADDDSTVEDTLREFIQTANDDEADFAKSGKALIRGDEILVHGKAMKDYVLRHVKNIRPSKMWDVAEKKLGAKREKKWINKTIKTKDVWVFPVSIISDGGGDEGGSAPEVESLKLSDGGEEKDDGGVKYDIPDSF